MKFNTRKDLFKNTKRITAFNRQNTTTPSVEEEKNSTFVPRLPPRRNLFQRKNVTGRLEEISTQCTNIRFACTMAL